MKLTYVLFPHGRITVNCLSTTWAHSFRDQLSFQYCLGLIASWFTAFYVLVFRRVANVDNS